MLPEVGALEYLVIAAVALIVVGPKDLPMLLRRLGQFVARLRGMANEFRASFDEMARQSELDDLRKEVEAMRRGQFADMAAHDDAMRSTVGDIHKSLSDVGVDFHQGPETFNYDAHIADEAAAAQAAQAGEAGAAKVTIADGAGAEPAVKPEVVKPKARKAAVKAGAKATAKTPARPATPKAATPGKAAPARKPRAKKTTEAAS